MPSLGDPSPIPAPNLSESLWAPWRRNSPPPNPWGATTGLGRCTCCKSHGLSPGGWQVLCLDLLPSSPVSGRTTMWTEHCAPRVHTCLYSYTSARWKSQAPLLLLLEAQSFIGPLCIFGFVSLDCLAFLTYYESRNFYQVQMACTIFPSEIDICNFTAKEHDSKNVGTSMAGVSACTENFLGTEPPHVVDVSLQCLQELEQSLQLLCKK